ncbi:hypothetical protein NEOKW01_2117 [Nematocida sp. AWRm80]|nr:hypothetical protein NEOKW01_2117 [Nematocida sp. AWRm80]
MSIRTEEKHKKTVIIEESDRSIEESISHSEEWSPTETEHIWVNTQDSIIGDKPYILPNGEIYKKRARTIMTPMQSESLKKHFKINPFPSAEVRVAISDTLGMKPRTVQIWFQNQRQKMKHAIQEEERIKNRRDPSTYTGEKEEEPLWVLAQLSCTVYSANNAM